MLFGVHDSGRAMDSPGCRELVPLSLEGPCALVDMAAWCSLRSGAGSVPGRAACEKGQECNSNTLHMNKE